MTTTYGLPEGHAVVPVGVLERFAALLDELSDALDGAEWSADTAPMCAEAFMRATGQTILEPDEEPAPVPLARALYAAARGETVQWPWGPAHV